MYRKKPPFDIIGAILGSRLMREDSTVAVSGFACSSYRFIGCISMASTSKVPKFEANRFSLRHVGHRSASNGILMAILHVAVLQPTPIDDTTMATGDWFVTRHDTRRGILTIDLALHSSLPILSHKLDKSRIHLLRVREAQEVLATFHNL